MSEESIPAEDLDQQRACRILNVEGKLAVPLGVDFAVKLLGLLLLTEACQHAVGIGAALKGTDKTQTSSFDNTDVEYDHGTTRLWRELRWRHCRGDLDGQMLNVRQ